MAVNANAEITRLKGAEDRMADRVTAFAGTMRFVRIHIAWFGIWILINLGVFGIGIQFDEYPFGLLTLIVSLEAIFLSTFVMISQNRQAAAAEIRSELDYRTNVIAENEIDIIMKALRRMAEKQGIGVGDLIDELHVVRAQFESDSADPAN